MSAEAAAPKPPEIKVTWYQHVWLGVPFVLIFVGGALGGACGGGAWAANHAIFQNTRNPVLRYVLTGLVTVAAFAVYFVLAGILYTLLQPDG